MLGRRHQAKEVIDTRLLKREVNGDDNGKNEVKHSAENRGEEFKYARTRIRKRVLERNDSIGE